MFSKKGLHPFTIIGLIAVLAACTSNATPVVKQTSVPATNIPLQKTQPATPRNTATPTATIIPPTRTPTPTPKPSLEDVLLADARHVQGTDDAPVTLIEFSDFK